MIVDCHTQIWSSPAQLGRAATAATQVLQADEARHLAAVGPVDKALVLAFRSRYLDAEIPNAYVADYVRRNAAKLIGFAGIDPTERGWLDALRTAQDDLRLRGVVISPELQDFHPCDTRVMRLYEECVRRGLPVVFDQHHRCPTGKLAFAEPLLLDEVAREFPELRIVIARLGHPWVQQTLVLLGKHAHVFADLAGVLRHPWLTYTTLLTAHEYGVMDKLLLGSDFPFRAPAACIEALYSINQFSHGSSLPPVPREQLRGIVERDALGLLGLADPTTPNSTPKSQIFSDDD